LIKEPEPRPALLQQPPDLYRASGLLALSLARDGYLPAMPSDEIVMYGTAWCGDCKRAKQFLGEQRVGYRFVDIDGDADGLAYVQELNDGKSIIPVLVFADGTTLTEPSNGELADKLGITTKAKNAFYDLIVVGSGPAGLTAALYAAREGLSTLVIERAGIGGQAGVTELLDNFPGFPEGVTGAEFAARLRQQADLFGVELLAAQAVTGLVVDGDYRGVQTGDGAEYRAFAVLLAVGSTYRRLGVPGEDDFLGAGVHFCATCDGAFYRDKKVLVVGGGNSAGEESIFLTRFSQDVTIITNGPALTASKVVQEKVQENPALTVRPNTTVAAFRGNGKLSEVVLTDTGNGQESVEAYDGVFVFIGLTPNTEVLEGKLDVDAAGFLVTDAGLQTSQPGVFAAGDVRAGSTKQAASAAGEGAAAALGIRRYVEPLASGIRPTLVDA
jgi:thioredoxin reductase (NADPH)